MATVAALVLALGMVSPNQVGCEPDETVAADRARIDVVVFDGDGDPLAGVLVFAGVGLTPQLESSTDATGHVALTVAADDQGATVLAYHDAGDANVRVPAVGGTRCVVSITIGAPTPDPIEGPDGRVSLAATPAARERGMTMQGVGIGMIAIGGALGTGGVIAGMIGPCGGDGASGTRCGTDTRTQLALGFGISGAAVVGGGIAMIVLGGKAMRARPVAGPTRGGWMVGLHTTF